MYRSAIYANRLYLALLSERHPELLASNGSPEQPHIIGHVRIHPTAHVDPTATVRIIIVIRGTYPGLPQDSFSHCNLQ